MKGFLTVLKFELSNYFQKKSFIISTVIISLVMIIGLSLPSIIDMSSILPGGNKEETRVEEVAEEDKTTFAIFDNENIIEDKEELKAYFPNSNWEVVKSEDELNNLVETKEVDAGFNIKGISEYSYVVQDSKFTDSNKEVFDEILKQKYRQSKMKEAGIDFKSVDEVYNTPIVSNVEVLGKDNANNYFYAYALIFVIYMMIIMYGQLIAMGITAEKSNRAIEVLVTSTSTNSLIAGKVIAGAIASVFQVGVIMASALISYNINGDAWNGLLDNVFKIPTNLLVTFVLFGIMGYIFYAFIFGALGALVSKTEELGTSMGPVMMIYMVVFFTSIFGLMNGDSMIIKVCSFIPFFSPMTMITRVAMGSIGTMEFIISFLILTGSTVLAAMGGAKIYRMATLMYGNPIKLKNALKWLKKEK